MGSPQTYYGVGDFLKISGGTTDNTPDQFPSAVDSGGAWSGASGAFASGGAAATGAKDAQSVFKNFNLSVPAGYTIRGIEVKLSAKSTNTKCQVGVELSLGGTNTAQQTTAADVDGWYTTYTLGGPSDLLGASVGVRRFQQCELPPAPGCHRPRKQLRRRRHVVGRLHDRQGLLPDPGQRRDPGGLRTERPAAT